LKSYNYIQIKRILLLGFFLLFVLVALIGKLGYIQVIANHDYQGVNLVSKSIDQRSRSVILDSGRGNIVDRYGKSFTGTEQLSLLILPRTENIFQKEKEKIIQLSNILNVSDRVVENIFINAKHPQLLSINSTVIAINEMQKQQITDLNISGVFFTNSKSRYSENMIARHVLGFIGEDIEITRSKYGELFDEMNIAAIDLIGKSGLEYTYELDLTIEGAKEITYYIYQDRYKQLHPYYGLGVKLQQSNNIYRPNTVQTTLDYNLQKYVELLFDQYKVKKGSIVIMDTANGDILAMVSRPNYEPYNIKMESYEYTKNRAVTASFPGSIFKTVIAIAALEEGLVNLYDRYSCGGSMTFNNNQVLKCWTNHGEVSFVDAFAKSCNITFANLAIQLGRDNIIKYSNALGLGEVVGYYDEFVKLPQVYMEEAGSVFLVEGNNDQLLANTGIGQQDVRITPLQVANMFSIIANYGKQYSPRLVTGIKSKNGHIIRKYITKAEDTSISRHTYYQVQKLLEQVVANGTAEEIYSEGILAAGKTGTAEIGKTGRVNRWFAGYYPAKYPQFSVAIAIENVESYEHIETPINIFKDIAQ